MAFGPGGYSDLVWTEMCRSSIKTLLAKNRPIFAEHPRMS